MQSEADSVNRNVSAATDRWRARLRARGGSGGGAVVTDGPARAYRRLHLVGHCRTAGDRLVFRLGLGLHADRRVRLLQVGHNAIIDILEVIGLGESGIDLLER